MFYSFVINKGSAHGVEVNDPVIYGKYLVGVVHSVKPTTSVVHTILDPKVNVSAYDVQSREFGYVTTTSELALKQECYLPGLERNTAITKGSVICTTGIGGIYPKDLIIGTVEDVLNDPHNVSAYALIKTGVIIPDLQDVFVSKMNIWDSDVDLAHECEVLVLGKGHYFSFLFFFKERYY